MATIAVRENASPAVRIVFDCEKGLMLGQEGVLPPSKPASVEAETTMAAVFKCGVPALV